MPQSFIVQAESKKDLDKKAEKLLEDFQPEALKKPVPTDIERLFEVYVPRKTKVSTGYKVLDDGILGVTFSETKKSWVDSRLYESKELVTHRRFRATVAHESAHCILHVHQLSFLHSYLTNDELVHFRHDSRDIPHYLNPEWQAWYMASGILMPRGPFEEIYKKLNGDSREIAEHFNVNPIFVRVRAGKLGL